MARELVQREARNFINLTEEPVIITVPSEEAGVPPRQIQLDPEKNPEEWLSGKRRPGDIMTMFFVNEDIVEMAKELHRTTSDMVWELLAEDEEPGHTRYGERIVELGELRTVSSGRTVIIAA